MPARWSRAPALVALLALACDAERLAGAQAPVSSAESAAVPTTREGFLAELSPLPSAALLVVYEVEGPGGLEGTLEIMLEPGGRRRENWALSLPVVGDRVELRGTTIQTPDVIYVEGPQGRAATELGLGALADAWLALEPAKREEVVAGVRRMHDRRSRARPIGSGGEDVVLGLSCRNERIATQDVCMWDAAGLPLRATGGGFSLQAIRVQPDPELGPSAFEIPTDVKREPDPDPIDAGPALLALAEGRPATIGAWLHPGLRMPSPRGGA